MGKTKQIVKKHSKEFFIARAEQKMAKKGVIKSGINPASEEELRRKNYLERIAIGKSKSKKEIAKIISQQTQNLAFKIELQKEEMNAKHIAITKYSIDNGCSRKVARKRMSTERRQSRAA